MRCGNCGKELQGGVKFCPGCGTPVAPANFGAPADFGAPAAPPVASFGDAPRPPLSGMGAAQAGKKSGCGKILLILLGAGVVILVGLGVAGYFGFRYAENKLKSSAAYALALKTLKENPEVAEQLGEVGETGFPLGAYDEAADGTGSAGFVMSVKGSKSSGQYEVGMTRSGGQWQMRTGRVTLAGGSVIEVWPPAGADGDAAPETFEGGEDEPMPPPPPAGKRGAVPPGTIISGGVLNGKATSKPVPAYPAAARNARASGAVVVQITVDEEGDVISASAISGHALLRPSAEAAARQARFTPTLLSGRPVKVRGVLTYNFNLSSE